MRKINLIVVHCAATKPDMDIGAAEIYKWHTDPRPKGRGWSDIGYHYVIRRNGKAEPGRSLDVAGAHAKGYNANSVGICLVGGIDEDGQPKNNFRPGQFQTLSRLINRINKDHPGVDVLGHCDLPGVKKACPCFDVRGWLTRYSVNLFAVSVGGHTHTITRSELKDLKKYVDQMLVSIANRC